MKTRTLLISIVLILLLTIAIGERVKESHAQTIPQISFIDPAQFRCGTEIKWRDLEKWQGKGSACGNGLLYTVRGRVLNVDRLKEKLIHATIVVPEDNNKIWGAYNGEFRPIDNAGEFAADFCITARTVTRPLHFQLYDGDGKTSLGGDCTVVLKFP
jgi:hypothetical protein